MSTPQRFKNKEYINWVKCSLSLIVMKEGLQVYVDTEVRNLHSHLEHKVALPTGRCSSCTWKDVRRTKRNPLTWYITCGSNVCNRWLSEILSVHTDPHSHSINWKNADINQWPTNPYEIAKVYMPKGQDRIHNLPKEFDAPAVLSLLKYCTWFSKNIPNVQLLSDLIDVRNEVLHSGELKVIDSNKDIWIDKMIQLLFDLNINGSAQSELNRIKREDVEINFRDYEIKALQNLVSGLFSKLAEVTGEMASLQNVQTQQSEETTKHAEEVQELKEIYDKIETFLTNNPDINDTEITKNMTDFKKDIQEELSQIKVKVSSLDDRLETLNDRLEKHIEETQLQFKGVRRQFDVLENKRGNNIQPNHQKDKFHVQVLQQCVRELVQDLDVDLILDYIGSRGIIHHVKIRDIREQTTTSNKTRMLIQYLMESDERSYNKFKKCLEESGQPHLKTSLEDVERKTGAKDPIYINLTKDEDLDSFVDLTCNQGVNDASVTVASSYANVPAAATATTDSGGSSYSIKSSTPTTPTGGRVHSIESLTPYQNRWRIRARVTQKGNIRTWRNSHGEGKLFSVNLVDESGEVKATGFNDAVDKFFNLLEVNKVFYISRATLKMANKQYSNVKNDYEMTFNNDTCIEPCEDDVDLPSMTFSFVKINELEKIQPNGLVDVIGTMKQCGDVSTVIGKQSQREITKREVQLVDQSGMVVALTLWGKDAESFDGSGNPVLAIKGARVSDWGGRSLSVLASSQLIINPDIREAHLLRGWYDREGSNMDFTGFKSEMGSGASGCGMNWKFFSQVKSENLGQGDKADYFTSKGTVIFLQKENCMYQACLTEKCNKKVIDQGNGMFQCEKCNREFPDFKWRMILSVNLADFSDNQWVTCFQESAEMILGKTAAELGHLRESNEAAFDQVFQDALFKSFIIKLRAKVETYNDKSRLRTVCTTANPIDWQEHGHRLVDDIKKMMDS